MKALLFVLAIPASADRLNDIEAKTPLGLGEIRDFINTSPIPLFRARLIPRFENITIALAKRLMGAKLPSHADYVIPSPRHTPFKEVDSIPQSFDAREAFQECNDIIGHVRDQSNCGSCW